LSAGVRNARDRESVQRRRARSLRERAVFDQSWMTKNNIFVNERQLAQVSSGRIRARVRTAEATC
jgi:hypothetical protein